MVESIAELHDEDTLQPSDKQKPHACQIVAIRTNSKGEKVKNEVSNDDDDKEDDEKDESALYSFQFEKDKLSSILRAVPADMPVAVVSVVGAFRTGKSFLLSWFLRYLTYQQEQGTKGGSEARKWYESFDALGTDDGFEWKAGSERHTTGIWIWSEPFFLETAVDGKRKKVAVLLVDTQGMFDHETTMALTASIFGFSTLLSSYQIYNVDKRIQEDNLQQLALFSEYARTAVASNDDRKDDKNDGKDDDDDDGNDRKKSPRRKPFQHIEFLVRDWQHFEDDDSDDVDNMDFDKIERDMQEYLDKVLQEREAKDLKDTREQIASCFEQTTCYGFCHPGFAVTKKKYKGDVKDLEPLFLRLLDRYCHRVFSPASLQPKVIHGRQLSARELGTYIEAYAELFTAGTSFPTAATMLEATASANNTNAVNLASLKYKETMDLVAGPKCSSYLQPEELRKEHAKAVKESLLVFESIANFGNRTSINEARDAVTNYTKSNYEVYVSLNDGRNPLKGLETYVSCLAPLTKREFVKANRNLTLPFLSFPVL